MPLPDTNETIRTPRGGRVLAVAGLVVLTLVQLVAGIALRHYSVWLAIAAFLGAIACIRQIFHFVEEWDEGDRPEANRPSRPIKPHKLPDEPGLVTVPRQFEGVQPRKSQPKPPQPE